uniref:CTD nuclear envelope phosphatase 1 homolog n=1 Tax=Bursaphelenchus xylophilus TaxID=6326 RepID=A0A1I7RWE0_BURXY
MVNKSNGRGSLRPQQRPTMISRFSTHVGATLWIWVCSLFSFVLYLFRRQYRTIRKHQAVKYDIVPLSPLTMQRLSMVKRKIMVLDLDETLIHSHHDGVLRPTVKPGTPPDFVLRVVIDRQPVRFFVHLRPHVDFFLTVVSQWYDLVVFTASMEVYGTSVADKLDRGRGWLNRRYFRQHCTVDYSGYTKDLLAIHNDLASVFILDNSPAAYRNYPHNAIPIKSWFSDPTDTCLLNLLPFLDALRFTSDVRSILSRNQHRQFGNPMNQNPLRSSLMKYGNYG